MNKLSNVSFVIPVRIDSYERSRNLDLLLDFITQFFESKIYIMENDSQQRYIIKKRNPKIEYHFVEDKAPIFHHTLCFNSLYQLVKTPIIAGWDTDAIVPPIQIIEVVKQLECGKAVIGLPYDGFMYGTEPRHVNLYQTTRNLEVLTNNLPYMFPMYGSLSVGGAFIVIKDKYLQSGGDNEYFHGWGPEDFERIKRLEILYPQFPIYRSSGCLFHLWHPRLINSRYYDSQHEIKGKQEYLKVCMMSTEKLREYVNNWPWFKKFNM
jgi:hypothetical protein